MFLIWVNYSLNTLPYTYCVSRRFLPRFLNTKACGAFGTKVAPSRRQAIFSSLFVILTWINPVVGHRTESVYVSPVSFVAFSERCVNNCGLIGSTIRIIRYDTYIHVMYAVEVTYVSSYSSFSSCAANSTPWKEFSCCFRKSLSLEKQMS